MDYGTIIGSLAAAIAGLALLLNRLHGRRDNVAMKDVKATTVPREEYNATITSLRQDIAESQRSLREEIRGGYQHVERRIDEGNRAMHERIDRLMERRDHDPHVRSTPR